MSVTGVDVPELSVAHSGAAQVTVAGRAATQVVDLIGIGTYDGRGLASQDADVSVSGSGGPRRSTPVGRCAFGSPGSAVWSTWASPS